MKIQEMDKALFRDVQYLWQNTSKERGDTERSDELLDFLLFKDNGASQWYHVPQTGLFVLTNVVPGAYASITPIALYTADAGMALREIQEAMREYKLQRLTALVPSPVQVVIKNLRQIGFVEEGRMVAGVLYDGMLVDQIVFGLYSPEVQVAHEAITQGKKKRRRRGRRKKKKAGEGAQTAPTDPATSGEKESPKGQVNGTHQTAPKANGRSGSKERHREAR